MDEHTSVLQSRRIVDSSRLRSSWRLEDSCIRKRSKDTGSRFAAERHPCPYTDRGYEPNRRVGALVVSFCCLKTYAAPSRVQSSSCSSLRAASGAEVQAPVPLFPTLSRAGCQSQNLRVRRGLLHPCRRFPHRLSRRLALRRPRSSLDKLYMGYRIYCRLRMGCL